MQVSKEAQSIGLCNLINNSFNFEIREFIGKVKIDPGKVTIVRSCQYLFNKQSYKINRLIHRKCEWKFCASSQLCWIHGEV